MFRYLIKAIKPFKLITLVAIYILGAGLVQYVQSLQIQTGVVEGGIFLIFFSISIELLRLLHSLGDIRQRPEDMNIKEIRQTRWLIAGSAAVLMTVAVTLFINWMVSDRLWLGIVFFVIALFFIGLLYYISDATPSLKPYQLLFESIFYVILPPAFAYFLHSDETHLFLTLVVAALIPAYLAYRLLTQLRKFGQDQKMGAPTLVVSVGWDWGMTLHSALILLTFVIFGIALLLGLPWFILWPVFLVLPIGLLEIFLMERTRRGAKPYWLVMKIASASVLFLPIYLIGFAFWIR